jgi:hypothetical protein
VRVEELEGLLESDQPSVEKTSESGIDHSSGYDSLKSDQSKR